jgi:D-alanyl-D-alanine dipeptidase
MNSSSVARVALLALLLATSSCASGAVARAAPVPPTPTTPTTVAPSIVTPIADARQLLLVTTPAWDSTSGTLRRYERDAAGHAWRAVGAPVAIVVGRTGLAWDDALSVVAAGEPVKREGDGKSPAGAFALDTAFGFPSRASLTWMRLPYVPLQQSTECVDDVRSAHYNTIVDNRAVPRVDWTSSEKMRSIGQYALGVHVAYNATPPKSGRGSCIFLHIWGGPSSVTAGCTAMDAGALEEIVRWLAPDRHPMLVQLPSSVLTRVRDAWSLPE